MCTGGVAGGLCIFIAVIKFEIDTCRLGNGGDDDDGDDGGDDNDGLGDMLSRPIFVIAVVLAGLERVGGGTSIKLPLEDSCHG